jgi:hypothetical protein
MGGSSQAPQQEGRRDRGSGPGDREVRQRSGPRDREVRQRSGPGDREVRQRGGPKERGKSLP